jgi:predicted small lipoprotein YifL
MFKKIKSFTLLLLIFTFTGCTTTYPSYQPYNSKTETGYRDLKLSNNIYKVSFVGNEYFSEELVGNYLLKRCAELTIERGYKYFIILKDDTKLIASWTTSSSSTNFSPRIPILPKNSNEFPYSYPDFPTSTSAETRTFNKYSDIAIIRLLKDNKKYVDAINANIIFNQLIDLPMSLEINSWTGPKFR